MKFVIHHHITVDNHYDLMVERGNTLITWQIPENIFNQFKSGSEIEAEKIQDHRKKYLEYQGPVSCDRGRVQIFDSGEYSDIIWNNEEIKINILGNRIQGLLSIIKNQGPMYTIKLTGNSA